MTKAEALAEFRAEVLPHVVAQYGRNDKPAIREAWNNYTDALCKNRQITLRQYESWVAPF
jgi:hypothetical protein